MEVKVYSKEGAEIGTVLLNDAIFGVEPNPALVHQYIVNYLANQRQGTASTKARSDVAGGGAKPWRQKGTGRARAGTNRSPIWKGGGITFGPKPRSFFNRFPKKMKRAALLSAFSDKAQNENVRVVDDLTLDEIKTKAVCAILDKLGLEKKKCLIIDEGVNHNLALSVRNIRRVKYVRAPLANPYDLVDAEILLMTRAGLGKVEEVFTS
jgi:large subunit ribosomal protein L4